ncbi:MAG TPA: FAD-dependent oxidoreductase [Verrucomicrobia bacterium]|nr:FAD-dependent oxidoreductase [Verrucomicrobiota bacterium]HOB32343.1 FAD-dependent oxidoreductase [Verrucomicrobiota bacterium]HOP96417.1 FAD-dependent oxidoreductase [Verrucomicrobiota bacterium]HPU56347.1 FAD-dependent oxidoreductase [Verrucomicrobiota bacterium]
MPDKSYWQDSAALPEFPPLNTHLDVDAVVLGGGLTGITTAWLLKNEGVRVALVERTRCAGADTGHTTAHLTFVTDRRLSELVKHFGRDAAKAFWEAGVAAIDQIFDIDRRCGGNGRFAWVPGYLHGRLDGSDADDRAALEADAQLARELGFDAEFIESVPLVRRPGIRFANQARFHPIGYVAPVLAAIHGNGSHVLENTEMSEVEENPLTVHAGRYRIRCDYLVIATHAPLSAKTGFLKTAMLQSKLSPTTSFVVEARLPSGSVPDALYWDTSDSYYYLRFDRHADHDHVILGGEDCKTGQVTGVRARFERLENRLKALLPNAELRHRWQGQVMETDDGLPFIGENASRQFIATGFSGNGMTLGTLGAMMARDSYLGRKNPWSELFAVDRKPHHAGAWRYIAENLDYPFYMLRDRLARAQRGSPDELPLGQGKILHLNGRKTAAYRAPDGRITLLSPVCTHMKCIVRWNDADKTWDCPCHGSRFNADGTVLAGPAETPLEKLRDE